MKSTFTKIASVLILSSFFSLSALVLIGSILSVTPVLAAEPTSFGSGYTPLAPLPYTNINECTGSGCKADFVSYLKGGFKLIIAGSAVLAVVMITIGGFQYMTAVSEGAKSEGKGRVENAIIGLCLALASYLFLNIINPQLTKLDQFKITPPEKTTNP